MSRRAERGFALIVVLWSLVFIALLATQMTASGRNEALLAGNLRRAAVLRAEADGLVHLAVFHLLDPASHWAADGAPRRIDLPGLRAELRVTDEAGKVNPNTAPLPVLTGLLQAVGSPAEQAARLAADIVAWRFPSADPPGTGEKAARYRAAGLFYAPPNAQFQSVAELDLVLGMTPELLARLAPHLTVFTDAAIDPYLADAAVSRALELAGLANAARLPAEHAAPPPAVVTIEAAVRSDTGARFLRRAVVSLGQGRNGRPYRIVAWDAPSS